MTNGRIQNQNHIVILFSIFPGEWEGVCPSIRLSYFEDTSKWDSAVPARARILLEHLYETYKEDGHPMDAKTPAGTDTMKSIFMQAIQNMTPTDQRAAVTEIESFFSGAYPCLDGDALKWWKVCHNYLYLC
jgi:hypothetical protein